jgi:hypothetical protein
MQRELSVSHDIHSGCDMRLGRCIVERDESLARIRDLETKLIEMRQLLAVRPAGSDALSTDLVAAIREIARGFTPDGTYIGRPIYEIAPECSPLQRDCKPSGGA